LRSAARFSSRLAREIRDRLRRIDNDVTRIDVHLAYMQRVMLATVDGPDIAMTAAERIAIMSDDELRAEQKRLHCELFVRSSGRHEDEPEYGRLLEAFGDACAEANRRDMPDQALEGERRTEG
jgi:hypothetical protein